jgi:hypothetical protein
MHHLFLLLSVTAASTVLVRLIAIPIAPRIDKVWLRAAACVLGEVIVFHSLLLTNGQNWRIFVIGAGCVLVQLALFRKLFSVTILRVVLLGTAHSAAVALIGVGVATMGVTHY